MKKKQLKKRIRQLERQVEELRAMKHGAKVPSSHGNGFTCSCCEAEIDFSDYGFCPWCGASLEGIVLGENPVEVKSMGAAPSSKVFEYSIELGGFLENFLQEREGK